MNDACTQCASLLDDGAVVCAHCGAAAVEPVKMAAEEEPVAEEEHAKGAVSEQLPAPVLEAVADSVTASVDSSVQRPVTPPLFSSGNDLNGIGGWLLLSAFGLAFAPFLIAHGVYGDLKVLFGERYQPGLKTHPGLAGLVMFESVTNSVFLAAVLALNYLLYNRKKAFPGSMIAYFVAQIVWVLTDQLMALHYTAQSDWSTLMRSVLVGVIWIPYYLQSRRVELTFVNE